MKKKEDGEGEDRGGRKRMWEEGRGRRRLGKKDGGRLRNIEDMIKNIKIWKEKWRK